MRATRAVALVALVAAVVLVGYVLLSGGDSGHSYRVQFETGGQLVKGNEVLVGGQPVGKVDELTLTDEGIAEVEITVDEPLHEGTTAVIRSTSLSGIANRYVSLSPGPNSAPELADGATLSRGETTSPVDLDQLFATLDDDTREGLQEVIQGSATVYAGNTEGARASYKYFAPSLQSTERLLAEVNRDQRVFTEFLTSGADILGAVAQKRTELSALTENANTALGAIAAENEALDRSLAALPPFMRQGNTTFANLRAALDDLDPLVETSKKATRNLPAFLRDLRPFAQRAVPVVTDLRTAIATPGPNNDLTDVLRLAPRVQAAAEDASREQIQAMNATQDELNRAVAYTPELLQFVTKLGQATAYYDGHGHYARVQPVASGAFSYNAGTEELDPIYSDPSAVYDFFTPDPTTTPQTPFFSQDGFERCPGAASQQAQDLSTPFVAPVVIPGGTPPGSCDPADLVAPGAAP